MQTWYAVTALLLLSPLYNSYERSDLQRGCKSCDHGYLSSTRSCPHVQIIAATRGRNSKPTAKTTAWPAGEWTHNGEWIVSDNIYVGESHRNLKSKERFKKLYLLSEIKPIVDHWDFVVLWHYCMTIKHIYNQFSLMQVNVFSLQLK